MANQTEKNKAPGVWFVHPPRVLETPETGQIRPNSKILRIQFNSTPKAQWMLNLFLFSVLLFNAKAVAVWLTHLSPIDRHPIAVYYYTFCLCINVSKNVMRLRSNRSPTKNYPWQSRAKWRPQMPAVSASNGNWRANSAECISAYKYAMLFS